MYKPLNNQVNKESACGKVDRSYGTLNTQGDTQLYKANSYRYSTQACKQTDIYTYVHTYVQTYVHTRIRTLNLHRLKADDQKEL